MTILHRLSPITLAALALFGCDQIETPLDPSADGLVATHVGGHLGSYRDCPEEAWETVGTDRPAGDAAQRPDGDIDADCDGDCGRLNCEAARLTFELRNDSEVAAEGIEAVTLFILDREGLELVELPIAATLDGEGQPFDGELAPGEQILLHVEFVGPLDILALVGPAEDEGEGEGAFAWQNGAQLRLLIGSATHADTGLDTPELYSLPEVDT